MAVIPKKLIEFLEENKNKSKEDIIKSMIKKFNYKKSTANTYYSVYYNVTDIRERIFNFFEENQQALRNNNIENIIDKLGVTKTTYLKYKNEYMSINNIKIPKNSENIKYYKGRAREKFIFDDSRL